MYRAHEPRSGPSSFSGAVAALTRSSRSSIVSHGSTGRARCAVMRDADPVAAWRQFGLAQHGRVAIVGFRDAAIPIELDQIFVPLYVYADSAREGLDHGGAEISLDEALARASRGRTCLALIGDPGAGKTTLLRHLFRRVVLDEVDGIVHLRGLHPVLIRLATVTDAELVSRGLRKVIARVAEQ